MICVHRYTCWLIFQQIRYLILIENRCPLLLLSERLLSPLVLQLSKRQRHNNVTVMPTPAYHVPVRVIVLVYLEDWHRTNLHSSELSDQFPSKLPPITNVIDPDTNLPAIQELSLLLVHGDHNNFSPLVTVEMNTLETHLRGSTSNKILKKTSSYKTLEAIWLVLARVYITR